MTKSPDGMNSSSRRSTAQIRTFNLESFGQFVQLFADERIAASHGETDHFHTAVSERFAADERRKLKNVIDLARGGKLGIDRHGKPERLLQQNELIGVFHISHTGDRVRAAEGACRHAAENVRFHPTTSRR